MSTFVHCGTVESFVINCPSQSISIAIIEMCLPLLARVPNAYTTLSACNGLGGARDTASNVKNISFGNNWLYQFNAEVASIVFVDLDILNLLCTFICDCSVDIKYKNLEMSNHNHLQDTNIIFLPQAIYHRLYLFYFKKQIFSG